MGAIRRRRSARTRHARRTCSIRPSASANESLPVWAPSKLTVCGGVPARLYRLSFSGELAYEIAVPAGYGNAMADALMDAGRPYGIVPYGTEALGVMRIEKGHIGGNEIDGRTTADDLGLGRMMSTKKDFIGKVMAAREGLQDAARPKLVGLRARNASERLYAGAHLLPVGAERIARNDEGVITSVAFSPSLDRWIGLGLLVRGPERHGETVMMTDFMRNAFVELEICAPTFIDPQGERLRVVELRATSPLQQLFASAPSDAVVDAPEVSLAERSGLSLAQIMVRNAKTPDLQRRLDERFGLTLPTTGRCSVSEAIELDLGRPSADGWP